jgi:hypothetical protein
MNRYLVIFFLIPFAFDAPAYSDQSQMIKEGQENILFVEDFSQDMNNWWVEGRDQVWIQDGHLYVNAVRSKKRELNVCTVWCKFEFKGDVRIEFDAHVISSPENVNNINFFLFYSDPNGASMYETRRRRSSGKYKLYHQLNGYIFTFLNDVIGKGGKYSDGSSKARFRVRRCPGFRLIKENFGYHCRKGDTYRITIIRKGNKLTYAVDGKVYLSVADNEPLKGGLIGLRTFSTFLWWDNITVWKLD